jgi:predicted exporter
MTEQMRNSLVWLVAVAAMATFVIARFDVTTDIAEFLPQAEAQEEAALVRSIATGDLSRRMVITAEAGSANEAVQVSRALESELRDNPLLSQELASVTGGPAEGTDEALWNIYHPRRLGFIADTVDEAGEKATTEGIERELQQLLEELRQPMSALITRVAPSDPYLVLPGLFEEFGQAQAGNIRLQDGRFVTRDGDFAVLFVQTRKPAFSADAQAEVLNELDAVFDAVNADFDGSIDFEMSGVNRFAVAAKNTIEADIRRISITSVIALTALLLLLFRSLRLVALASVPLVTGVLAGMATTLIVFGRIHGITLAFGAALIGVAVDYVVHFYCHHTVTGEDQPGSSSIRSIWPALLLGALTTIAGFIALAFSSFAGLQEAACFALAGLVAALLTTRFVIPQWVSSGIQPVAVRAWLVGSLQQGFAALRARQWPVAVAVVAVAILSIVAFPKLEWSDGLVEMGEVNPQLMEEEERVRSRVSRFEQTRFILSLGDTPEDALQTNDAVADILRTEGLVSSFSSANSLLPSAARQRAVSERFTADDAFAGRFRDVAKEVGFSEGAFSEFLATIREPLAEPVTYGMLSNSPLANMMSTYRVDVDGRPGFVTFLHDVQAPGALEQEIDAIEGAHFLDQNQLFEAAGQEYRQRTITLLALGLLAIIALMAVRYRSARKTLAALSPSLLAVSVALSALGLLGESIDLVVVTALLMVVSMGVDYGVFLVDGAEHGERASSAALLSIVVAGLSTLLGFGLLSLSGYPILFRIGVTAAIGITAAMVLAPISITILGARNDS